MTSALGGGAVEQIDDSIDESTNKLRDEVCVCVLWGVGAKVPKISETSF